jgi:ubiquinone/menaquinone biosynthesis C-methylase UbiE
VRRRDLVKLGALSPWLLDPAQASAPPKRLPPYVLTIPKMVDYMLRIAHVRAGDVVYDLGCGDGRIVIAAAKQFGTRGVGVDINPRAVAVARENAIAAGVEKIVTFRQGDLFDTDVSDATVVMLYLFAEMMLRLKPKLLRELPDGARIVSHDFDFGKSWPPDNLYDFGTDAIYLWKVPPRSERAG